MALQRLEREFVQLMREPIPVATVSRNETDPYRWTAHMIGPPGSPYETGIIKVELIFSTNYPISAPNIIFPRGFYHANIGEDGHVCTNLFSEWRSTDTLLTILLALNDLLANPNRNSAYQGCGLSDDQYFEYARQWTNTHGHPST